MTTLTCTLVVVLLLGALCDGNRVPENACSLRGSLEVFSRPADIPVTAAQCDITYDKQDFEQQPTVRYLAAKPGETYTLFMLDPDAPDRPKGVYYLHWILANIPGADFRNGLLGNSTLIASYLGPAPPEGTGLHRYMFYVYRHSPRSGRLAGTVGQSEREFFPLRDYLRRTSRQGVRLRGPLAGVQFRSAFRSTAAVDVLF